MKRLDEILSKTVNAAISADQVPAPDPEVPACHICGDAGFVRRQRPIDHPMFGKAEPCECSLREDEAERRSRLERIGNLAGLGRFTLETFDPEQAPFGARLLETANAYAESPEGWLVFTGPSGSGKTHLAAAIANARVARGEPAFFMVVPDLLDHLRAGYGAEDEDESYERLFEQVRNAAFLVLDDIDAAAPTDWAREKLYQLINSRFTAELPTVFTCAGLTGLDDRLATRLQDARLTRVLVFADGSNERGGYHEIGGMSRERLDKLRFGVFQADREGISLEARESLRTAAQVALDFSVKPEGKILLISGANGCGKTHLAGAIANRCLASGMEATFAVVPDLLDHLRAAYAPTSNLPYDEVFERVRNAQLLVLDDLGAQAPTPWANEKLYQVVNYRLNTGLPTVITTDLRLAGLELEHPRIWARVMDGSLAIRIEIQAPHFYNSAHEERDRPTLPRRDRRR